MLTAPYNVRIVLYAADERDPIFAQSIDISADDLKLGVPARVMGRCTQEICKALDALALRERKRRTRPMSLRLPPAPDPDAHEPQLLPNTIVDLQE